MPEASPAYTIHRKIYRHDPNGATRGWDVHMPAENKLRDAVLIADEASMIVEGDGKANLLDDLVTLSTPEKAVVDSYRRYRPAATCGFRPQPGHEP